MFDNRIVFMEARHPLFRFILRFVLALAVCFATLAHAANFGTAVNVIGQAIDLTYDSQRNLVYIANQNQNRIEVYSVSQGRLLNPINIGNLPASVAIPPDKQTLYIANNISLGTITLVDLSSQAARDDIPLNARPDAVAVGNDGLVLI